MIIVRVRRLWTIFSARESEQLPSYEAIISFNNVKLVELNFDELRDSVSLSCFNVASSLKIESTSENKVYT